MQSLTKVQNKIASAAERVGRDPSEITLIAVTKTHGAEEINEAIAAGVTDIGENKVQEILSKYDDITPGVRWHLIGHLQTNKVKSVVDKVCMIHSVDSLHLAQEIDKRCRDIGKVMDVLIQVNAAGEEQKSGVPPEEVFSLYEEISKLGNLRVRGLMQIAPQTDNPESVRKYFKQVKEIFDSIPGLDVLSMGMSGDYKVAIEEGANLIRIGTAIFGKRDYTVK